jgi:hypothetical protein
MSIPYNLPASLTALAWDETVPIARVLETAMVRMFNACFG